MSNLAVESSIERLFSQSSPYCMQWTPGEPQPLFFSLSAFLNARFLIASCAPLLYHSSTPSPFAPKTLAMAHCRTAWLQNGVLLYLHPCAPPVRLSLVITLRTKCRGDGISQEARRILDMALVTRYDCTSSTVTLYGASSAPSAVDQCCRKALLPE